MNEQDRLYRLMRNLLETLGGCPDTVSLAQALMCERWEKDGYRRRTHHCAPSVEWMEAIEQGLPYVERALDEQRRFLRSRREVVRIDRARGICAESVRHLAQHADYITHTDEKGEVTPNRLLVVEREDSFAIYENRFLFTLVMIMQDFVDKRFQAIACLNGSTTHIFEMVREITKEKIHLKTHFCTMEKEQSPMEETCVSERLQLLRIRVNALGAVQLIKLLKGTPLVSSPIVRTNVMKKNLNFKKALELYEYLTNSVQWNDAVMAEEQEDRNGVNEEAIWELCALNAVQAGVVRLFADRTAVSTLKRRFDEENLRRERDRLALEKHREEVMQARIEQAKQAEAGRYQEELAWRDAEIIRLARSIEELHLSMMQCRESAAQWERTLREQMEKERRHFELDMRRLELESVENARRLSSEQASRFEKRES